MRITHRWCRGWIRGIFFQDVGEFVYMCVYVCAMVMRVCVINVIIWKRSFLKMKVTCSGSLHPCNSHVYVCVCVPSDLEPPPILAPGASQDRPLPFGRWRLSSLALSEGLFLKTPFRRLSWILLQRFPYRQDPWRKNLQFSGEKQRHA